MLWCISKCLLFPYPCQKPEGIFLWYCGSVVKVLAVNLTILWGPLQLGLPVASALWAVHTEPPAIHQAEVRVCSPSTGLILLVVSVQVSRGSLYSPVSLSESSVFPNCQSLQPWGQWFSLHSLLSQGSKKSCRFSICSAFYLLVGQSGDFWVPYMWNLIVSIIFLRQFFFFLIWGNVQMAEVAGPDSFKLFQSEDAHICTSPPGEKR